MYRQINALKGHKGEKLSKLQNEGMAAGAVVKRHDPGVWPRAAHGEACTLVHVRMSRSGIC